MSDCCTPGRGDGGERDNGETRADAIRAVDANSLENADVGAASSSSAGRGAGAVGTRVAVRHAAGAAPDAGAGAGGTHAAGAAGAGTAPGAVAAEGDRRDRSVIGSFVDLDGGAFLMGTNEDEAILGDGESPVREVVVGPYAIARTAVTVAEFAAFVSATGHETDAERFGWSFVFHLDLASDHPPTRALAAAPWWRQVHGAGWRHPAGPETTTNGGEDHPVVHVSHADALAYCVWAGVRLPTEPEWEFAARGGLSGARYPWGDEFTPGGRRMANLFDGEFPATRAPADGETTFAGTAPADAFPPNGFGLYNAAGNVWEWCADRFQAPNGSPNDFVVRGGSHLCHRSYCDRYRVAARTGNAPDSSLSHTGFRVARDR